MVCRFGVALYAESRWVVNEGGERVKLACVNWVAHLDTAVAEGLHKQPLDVISNKIKSMGFNCNLGLLDAIDGVEAKSTDIIDLPLTEAFQGKMEEEM
ncbi:hypothetical protein K1719_015084 [Acacia pycnantha]|nr:hypothetical protein K1719_015084 [Acacia pycnantha]